MVFEDHFDRHTDAHIVRLDAAAMLVTDRMPSGDLLDALTAADVEIAVG